MGGFACSLHDVALFLIELAKREFDDKPFAPSTCLLAPRVSVSEFLAMWELFVGKNRDGSEMAKCNSYQNFFYSWSICRFYDVEDSMILKNKATVTCINSCCWQAEKCTFVLIRNTSSSLALKFMMKLLCIGNECAHPSLSAFWSHV